MCDIKRAVMTWEHRGTVEVKFCCEFGCWLFESAEYVKVYWICENLHTWSFYEFCTLQKVKKDCYMV